METSWDGSQNWNTVVGGYRLLRKDRLGQHERTALYMRLQWDVCLQMYSELGTADGSALVGRPHGWQCGGCHRLPCWEENVDEAFSTQLEEFLSSQALCFMRDLKPTKIRRKENTVVHGKSKPFWECIEGTFLTQVIKEPMRGGAPLDLIQTRKNWPGYKPQEQAAVSMMC